jgi:hypothetical protein
MAAFFKFICRTLKSLNGDESAHSTVQVLARADEVIE